MIKTFLWMIIKLVARRVIQFPCFLVEELEPTQGHMARGGNGPGHSALPLDWLPGENSSFQRALDLLIWAMSMNRPPLTQTTLSFLQCDKLQVQTYIRAFVNRSMIFKGKSKAWVSSFLVGKEMAVLQLSFPTYHLCPKRSSVCDKPWKWHSLWEEGV